MASDQTADGRQKVVVQIVNSPMAGTVASNIEVEVNQLKPRHQVIATLKDPLCAKSD